MEEQVQLRFYLTNFVQWHHEPLYEALVKRARHDGLAGATVLKGLMGFSTRDGKILREKALAFANELPVIVEMIDSAEALAAFRTDIAPMLKGALLTYERARVLARRARTDEPGAVPLAAAAPPPEKEAPWMEFGEKGTLLRLFLGDEDRDEDGKPLFEAIVYRARNAGLAGATVLRGQMGFGKHSHLHTAHLLTLSQDLPIVIEIVDTEENIEAFLPEVDRLVNEGLVTVEEVRIVKNVG
ncbi:DUF190 domain-containing protein [bacterium]|nr:DUF190 domain-containing protein [bacterium]